MRFNAKHNAKATVNLWFCGVEAVEKEFRQRSTEEREKFEIESLVNIDNIKVQRTFIPKDNKLGKYLT